MIAGLQRALRSGPLTVALLLAPVAGPAEDDLMQRDPWAACEYCHGREGRSDGAAVPAIAGQSAGYIRKQLADFRAGRRTSPERQMSSAVMLLDAADDARVAAYFASRTAALARPVHAAGVAEPTPNDADPGARLYWRGTAGRAACVTCHAASRSRLQAAHPYLFGLHRDYVARQLRAFRAGIRGNDPQGVMRAQARALDDSEIDALARYLATH